MSKKVKFALKINLVLIRKNKYVILQNCIEEKIMEYCITK